MFGGLDLSVVGLLGAAPPRPETSQAESFGKWKPLPDDFLSRAGVIWTFYLDNVVPNLVAIQTKRSSIKRYASVLKTRKEEVGASSKKYREIKLWEKILIEHVWLDCKRCPTPTFLPFVSRGIAH